MKEVDLIFEKDEYIEGIITGIKGIFTSFLMVIEVLVFDVLLQNPYYTSSLKAIILWLCLSVIVFCISLFFINYNIKCLQEIDIKIRQLHRKERIRQEKIKKQIEQEKIEKKKLLEEEMEKHFIIKNTLQN